VPDALMSVEGVGRTYPAVGDAPAVIALQDIDLHIARGEFVAICGPSGCGKTTLLELLSGLQRPTSGRVVLAGEEVTGPRREIGVVFQEESTFPWRTVLENVEFGLQMQGVGRGARRRRAAEMVELVGLAGFEHAYPHALSGGMRQRVAIARTLVCEPEVVVMDEPFGALDEQTRLILGGELLRIVAEAGATVLFVTHSIQEAALLSDRVVVLSARPGRIKTEVANPLPRPRDASVLTTGAFASITQQVWGSLEEEALRPRAREVAGV
jgi:NitT/TauT family transport system ATP-binding protein